MESQIRPRAVGLTLHLKGTVAECQQMIRGTREITELTWRCPDHFCSTEILRHPLEHGGTGNIRGLVLGPRTSRVVYDASILAASRYRLGQYPTESEYWSGWTKDHEHG